MNPASGNNPNDAPPLPSDGNASPELPSVEYLIHAPEHEYTDLVARHWDDLEWAELWMSHLAAFDENPDRRELHHQTAKANTHPTLDDKLLRCHLTRLKWAGYAGKSRCSLENEIIYWAIELIGEWGERGYLEGICPILTKWERDLDAVLRDALHHALADENWYGSHEAIIPALAAHAGGDSKLRDVLFAQLGNFDASFGRAAAKALVALSMREDAQVEGASRPLGMHSVAASTDAHSGGTHTLPAQASLSIKQELLTRFQSGEGNDDERGALALGLSELAVADAAIKDVLRVRFESGKGNDDERFALAQALSGLAGVDAAIKDALRVRFESGNGDKLERRDLVLGLSGLAGADASLKDALRLRFQSGAGSNSERSALARGLSSLAEADPAVKAAPLTRFESGDGHWQERSALARGLRGLAGADPAVKAALLARFQSGDGGDEERCALVQGLSGLAWADATLKDVLRVRFESAKGSHEERRDLAEGLSLLAGADAALKDALLVCFQSGKGDWLERVTLAQGLAPLAGADAALKDALRVRFESSNGYDGERRALASGLAPLALRDADLRSVLIARLNADTGLHTMSITTATWRVLRLDRFVAPAQQPQL